MRSLTRLQAILLGLLVLIGLGLLGLGLYAVAVRQGVFSKSFHVRAGFPDIAGVEIGTRVRIQGVQAGEVVEVLPPAQAGEQVMLRLRIKSEYRALVRTNSKVRIANVGMLGGKVLDIIPGKELAEPVEDNAVLATTKSVGLSDLISGASDTLQGVKGFPQSKLYQAPLDTGEELEETVQSIKRAADGLKRVPIIGGYIEDPRDLLIRPQMERNRKWFKESDLFPPGRAVLTESGQAQLDALADWLEGLKHSGSEVVVVSFASPKSESRDVAKVVTTEQAKTVVQYLKDKHKAHKMTLVTSRKVTPLGMGVEPSPVPEREKLPTPRVEILVFVPQR